MSEIVTAGEVLPAGEVVPGLVSVVIPNWNGKRFLKGVLDSLREQTYKPIEVLVVDNGSHDGSVEFMSENYPEVKIARFEKNTGFAPAVNRGIRESCGEFIALINNDTIVDPQWVAELVKGMAEHPECGSMGCKMLAYDDRTLLDGVGDVQLLAVDWCDVVHVFAHFRLVAFPVGAESCFVLDDDDRVDCAVDLLAFAS